MTNKWRRGALGVVFMAALLAGCDVQNNPNPAVQQQTRAATQTAQAPAYFVNVDLRQSHFSLDPFKHIGDAMNASQFPLPTSKALYEKLKKGDNLVDEFRSASFWIEGSIGNTEMTVKDMPAVQPDADASAYRVKFELYSLDIMKHIKNAANKVEFNWEVPGNIYENLKVGDDMVTDGFRVGSFALKGSVGAWHLRVKEKNGLAPNSPQPKAAAQPKAATP